MELSRFRDAFGARARRVRTALAARSFANGTVLGSVLAATVAPLLALLGRVPWIALAFVPLGALAAAGVAAKRRWSDTDVALYLDARLTQNESITTALGLASGDVVGEHVAEAAVRALDAPAAQKTAPRVFRRAHAILPLALTLVAFSPRFSPPVPPPTVEHPPDRVRVSLDELRKVEVLAALSARTADERARREALERRARDLKERARQGLDRRDALDQLAKLRDAVTAERRVDDPAARKAASGALAKNPDLQAAADALGRGDLTALDHEMERLARSLEARARREALASLDEAREAAIARGDGELADALGEQRRLLERRSTPSEAMKKLARMFEGMLPPGSASRTLKHLERESAVTSDSLAGAMAEALEGLTPEERAKVARAMAQQAKNLESARSLSQTEMNRLAEALKSPDARAALARALKAIAEGGPAGAAEREQALAAADAALAIAAGRVAAAGNDGSGDDDGTPGDSSGDGDPGAGPGGGKGKHDGTTPAVAGSSFAAKAQGQPSGGIPIGVVTTQSPGPATGATLLPRLEALGAARPRELGAVERSNVPREYREQVGRYFAP